MGTWKLKLASPGCISRIWMIYHREQIKLLSFQVPGTQNVHKPLIFVQTADATIAGKLSSRFTLSKLEPISKLSKISQILGLSGFGFYFRLGEILWGPAVSFFFGILQRFWWLAVFPIFLTKLYHRVTGSGSRSSTSSFTGNTALYAVWLFKLSMSHLNLTT